jgi:thymidylate synthase
MYNVATIRKIMTAKLGDKRFVTDKSGVKTIELVGYSFLADEPAIFGKPNNDYIERELEWYESKSLYVNDIPGKTPPIWEQISNVHGIINSNYGYLIYSEANGNQYERVLEALRADQNTRRAVMIYQRPSMHDDYNSEGMSDFICTNAVQYLVREGKLVAIVQMRSNDAYFGYRNDYAWQRHVQTKLANELGLEAGNLVWNAGSLHLYERHFNLVTPSWD